MIAAPEKTVEVQVLQPWVSTGGATKRRGERVRMTPDGAAHAIERGIVKRVDTDAERLIRLCQKFGVNLAIPAGRVSASVRSVLHAAARGTPIKLRKE